jgi:hypothetical protein
MLVMIYFLVSIRFIIGDNHGESNLRIFASNIVQ